MTLQEDILQATEQLFGSLSQEDHDRAEALIYAVVPYLRSRLRSDVREADIKPTFIVAAALLTMSMLDASGFDNLQALSAGTMQLTFDGKNDRRVRLALMMLAPFSHGATAFRGVTA